MNAENPLKQGLSELLIKKIGVDILKIKIGNSGKRSELFYLEWIFS